MWMPVFTAIFERVAGNLFSVDGSATQLPAILLATLLDVDDPIDLFLFNCFLIRDNITRCGCPLTEICSVIRCAVTSLCLSIAGHHVL